MGVYAREVDGAPGDEGGKSRSDPSPRRQSSAGFRRRQVLKAKRQALWKVPLSLLLYLERASAGVQVLCLWLSELG